MKRLYFFFLVFLPLACLPLACAPSSPPADNDPPNGVIFFIADGCGPATYTFARDWLRSRGQGDLSMDPYRSGAVQTFASDSDITDSAASATAYACGVKTYNGAIGVDAERNEVQTILEAAEGAGWRTGLISTARITHATPASFSAHVVNRGMEAEIASQQITKGIEVIFGGGSRWYLPREEGGSRSDGRNLLKELGSQGYHVVRDRTELMQTSSVPVVGLFSESHMAYDIDRDRTSEPALADMTRKALELLSASGEPFFIMIEAGRIDHAGHGNDASAHLQDMLAYHEAFQVALDFTVGHDNTLILATSDHETGGLTLGAEHPGVSSYDYDATRLAGTIMSIERFGMELDARIDAGVSIDPLMEWVTETLSTGFDTVGYFEPMRTRIRAGVSRLMAEGVDDDLDFLTDSLVQIQASRARLGWSTGGHTAVDVPLFAHGPGADIFVGVLDNSEIGIRLAEVMKLDL